MNLEVEWERRLAGALVRADGVARRALPRRLFDAAAIFAGSQLDRMYGRNVDSLMSAFRERERWARPRLDAYRNERLRTLLIHAQAHVPFYRSRLAGMNLAGTPALDLLEQLPVLTKGDVRAAGKALMATDRTRRTIVAKTSGSTGKPLVIAHDLGHAASCRAAQRRAFSWFGVHPYAPRVMLLAMPRDRRTFLKHQIVDLATGRRLVEFADLSEERLAWMVKVIRAYRPTLVTAYASVLHELCHYANTQGLDLASCGVRLLHSQSEMLLDTHRRSIARAFPNVPLIDEYGSVEVGAMAYTCERGSMHVSDDHVVMEVVDEGGRRLPYGSTGRILFTPLHARATPLVRFEIGDEGCLDEKSCPCGRFPGQPTVSALSGRIFERVLTADGRSFSAGTVHFLVRSADLHGHLAEYLGVQRALGHLHFLLVPAGALPAEADARLRSEARRLYGNDFVVTTELVERIPREKRKKSYFSSELTA